MPCINPEMPYCPACPFGRVSSTEDLSETDCVWECLYDPTREAAAYESPKDAPPDASMICHSHLKGESCHEIVQND